MEQEIDSTLYHILDEVADPEIPVLSVVQMGVVRKAQFVGTGVVVDITPTYSGCPAMDMMGDDIKKALQVAGYEAKVNLIL